MSKDNGRVLDPLLDRCTCQTGRDTDGSEFGLCPFCEEQDWLAGSDLRAKIQEAVLREREACAKVLCRFCRAGWPHNEFGSHYNPRYPDQPYFDPDDCDARWILWRDSDGSPKRLDGEAATARADEGGIAQKEGS